MSHEVPAEALFDFVCKDFRKAWDAMAVADFDIDTGGNFMFARQAMALLELTCRVAAADESGDTLRDYSAALLGLDPLLFTRLPDGPRRLARGCRAALEPRS
jgi:hypothetical protein